MKIGRRGFLRGLGGVAVATIAAPIIARTAPLFIPSDRLDFGVPRALLSGGSIDGMTIDGGPIPAGFGDDTALLQGLIDRGEWIDPDRTYYVSRPIEMRSGTLHISQSVTPDPAAVVVDVGTV